MDKSTVRGPDAEGAEPARVRPFTTPPLPPLGSIASTPPPLVDVWHLTDFCRFGNHELCPGGTVRQSYAARCRCDEAGCDCWDRWDRR